MNNKCVIFKFFIFYDVTQLPIKKISYSFYAYSVFIKSLVTKKDNLSESNSETITPINYRYK